MKRLIAAVSLCVLTLPGFAVEAGKPFEDLDIDRALPYLPERSASYQEVALDRVSPNTEERRTVSAASSGQTRAVREDAINGSFKSFWATGPWANDHYFIAPPQ